MKQKNVDVIQTQTLMKLDFAFKRYIFIIRYRVYRKIEVHVSRII